MCNNESRCRVMTWTVGPCSLRSYYRVERALTSPADPFSEANFSAEKLDSRVGSRGSGFLHYRPSGGCMLWEWDVWC